MPSITGMPIENSNPVINKKFDTVSIISNKLIYLYINAAADLAEVIKSQPVKAHIIIEL